MRKTLTLALLLPALALSVAGKKEKKDKKGNAPAVEGWSTPSGGTGECHYPPAFASLAEGPRRIARQKALEEAMVQWRGERDDGVAMSENVYTNVETVLLGHPADIEPSLIENLAWCEKVRRGQASVVDWQAWLTSLPAKLTEGECKGSLLPNTLHDYLNIHGDWHIPTLLCKDDVIVINATDQDYYRVERGGPWINAAGDTSKPGSGEDPCTMEGCYKGTLLLRFQSDSGAPTIVPIGLNQEFRAPENGRISVMINDSDFTDNEWKVEARMQHHTGITYAPR